MFSIISIRVSNFNYFHYRDEKFDKIWIQYYYSGTQINYDKI